MRANIRNRRIELGIPQRELAEILGVAYQFIQKIESHNPACFKESPSIERLWTLAEALKCLPHDLLIPGRFKGPPEDEDCGSTASICIGYERSSGIVLHRQT